MVLLVDWQIRRAVEAGQIGIDGYDSANVGPNSYDVTLAGDFYACPPNTGVCEKVIDPRCGVLQMCRENKSTFYIQPGEFILGSTVEYFKIEPGIVAFVHGRSSWARIGLQIHAAGLLDSGWEGNITLEIVNFSNRSIVLRDGDRIGQVTFDQVEVCETPYYAREKSKYDRQVGATESRLCRDYSES